MTATTVPPAPHAATVPDAVAPPPGNPRFPLLDSLRAIAVLSVLLFHASGAKRSGLAGDFLTRMEVGVAIFFVLSGFLIYRPFVNARMRDAPPVKLGTFMRRRALRVLPAYWAALTLLAIWPGLPGVFSDDWWKYYGLLQVYWFDSTIQGLGIAWSLCIEVTFYLLLPLYAVAAARLLRDRPARTQVTAELTGLAVLAAASLALRFYLREEDPASPLLHTLPAYLAWFALGMGFAVLSVRGTALRLARFPLLSWVLAGVAFLVLAYGVDSLSPDSPARAIGFIGGIEDVELHLLYGAVAALLVFPAVFSGDRDGVVRDVLAWAPLAWVGLVSYGIYLYQLPIVQQVDKAGLHQLVLLGVAAAAVTTAVAAASYYSLERPLLRFKRRS